jgi:hypothetical protein
MEIQVQKEKDSLCEEVRNQKKKEIRFSCLAPPPLPLCITEYLNWGLGEMKGAVFTPKDSVYTL